MILEPGDHWSALTKYEGAHWSCLFALKIWHYVIEGGRWLLLLSTICIVMATTGDHWSLLFQLWRSSLIISSCTTKTIIGRLLYQLHVQRHALIASFISFMLKGDHCSLLLSAMCLMAITDCLCYQLYDWRRSMVALFYQLCDWRRSMIASFINYMTLWMEERHWSLPLSALCLKAITRHCFDEW